MLRRFSALFAAAAVIGGLCTVPALSASAAPASHASRHNFSVPTISHRNVVTAWGNYTKINSARVHVQICAKQTGSAFAVGAQALVYNTRGKTKNISAVIILGRKGDTACGQITFTFYSAHLKVFTFVGQGGRIIARSSLKKIY
jgi:hypothetical protein